MMTRVYDVLREPRGDMLRKFFRAIAQHSSAVTMVLRDDLGLDESGRQLLLKLRPSLISEARTSSWPGTVLLDEEARVLGFSLWPDTLDVLMRASDGLYGWCQPVLPEDLAFLRDDRTVLFASIRHERDAYLEVSEDEYQSLVHAMPTLVRILQPRVDAPEGSGGS